MGISSMRGWDTRLERHREAVGEQQPSQALGVGGVFFCSSRAVDVRILHAGFRPRDRRSKRGMATVVVPSPNLSQRLDSWSLELVAGLEAQASNGHRHVRLGHAGPLRVRHTFGEKSSHAPLLDSLMGLAGPDSREVTIHSVQVDVDVAHRGVTHLGPLPWSAADFDDYGRPRGLETSPWRLAWDRAHGAVRCYHRELRTGLFLTKGPVQSWEFSSPMLAFWHWAAATEGAAMVHGGTIGTETAMGIVGGPSGTGKSTTVLLGMREGLRSCGDDYVWLQANAQGAHVWAVYRTIKTVADSPFVPAVSERTQQEGTAGKQIHWVPSGPYAPGALLPRAPLKVAWVLAAPGRLHTPNRIEALSALLPSTLLRLSGDHAAVSAAVRSALATVEVRPLPRNGDFEAVARELIRGRAAWGDRE